MSSLTHKYILLNYIFYINQLYVIKFSHHFEEKNKLLIYKNLIIYYCI